MSTLLTLNEIRKAQASILAVSERQSLETLGREEKTALRTLGQLKGQIEEMETKRNKLTEDTNAQGEKKTEVTRSALVLIFLMEFLSLSKNWQLCKLTWSVLSKNMTIIRVNGPA